MNLIFNFGGKSNETRQLYFIVLYTCPTKQIIEVNKMSCKAVMSTVSLPYEIIFNTNKQFCYGETCSNIRCHSFTLSFSNLNCFSFTVKQLCVSPVYIRDHTFMTSTQSGA